MSKLSEAIASLSSGSGPYYQAPRAWHEALKIILKRFELEPEAMPEIHNEEGRNFINVFEKGALQNSDSHKATIYFTWYRMYPSGNWEIICYLTEEK